MTGNIIRIFNRAPFGVIVTKDGRDHPIPPGYSHITSDLLRFAREQNPVPGSEDATTLQFESLISRVAPPGFVQRDSLEPISQEVLDLMPKERINRRTLEADRQDGTEQATAFPRGRVAPHQPTVGMIDPGKFDG
jgi:hypothetical protein